MAAAESGHGGSGYVFLAGHGLLVLGYIFFTVGFATDHWLTTDFGHHGLWEKCVDQLCEVISPGQLSGWVEATRTMQTMALMCHLGGVLAALYLHCLTLTFPPPSPSASASPGQAATATTPLQKKARVLEICTAVGCGFCLIGVSAFGGKGKDEGTLGYSYGLSVFSLFLSTTGTVMVAVTRSAVTTSANSVSPQQQTAVTSPHSHQYPQHSGAAFYPYGQGQHTNLDRPRSGGGVYGQSERPIPYGRNAAASPAPLPYSMHPEGPGGNTENFGAAMTMPEPGPIAGGGGGFGTMTMPEPGPIGGGGGRGMAGQTRVQGRLPPISEVSPSAPPPPPDIQGEQPPSYLEAIGHTTHP
ncbi:hypothetical protein ACOMHN_037618 [Nucella lapillus]